MNKKGFTLAEILGVIVIIALLLLLIMPTIIDRIAQSGNKAGEVNDSIIFDAVDDYISENISTDKAGSYCIPIQDLIDDGKLVGPVIDVETGDDISDKTIFVTIDNQGNITHQIMESDECDASSTIHKIDFIINPNNNKWVHERKVIIKYPNMGSGYTYQYKIDNGSWQTAKAGNFELPVFKKISTLQARVTGATVITNSTNIINIDNENPTINSLSVERNSKISIKAKDNVSGIVGYYISTSNTKPAANATGWVTTNIPAGQEGNITVTKSPGTYYVWVKDKADNVSSNSDGSGNSITIQNKTLTVNFAKGTGIASIGSTSKSCTVAAGNDSCTVTLPSITPNSGYITDGWYNGNTKVGNPNNTYTVTNNVTLTAKAHADNLSLTISTTNTTSKINVVANVTSSSKITKYEYSKDGGKTWEVGNNTTHTFNNLTQGTTYNIVVRVTSETGKVVTAVKSVTTSSIGTPTFKQSGIYPITVTITYPDGCGSNLTCTYTKDNGQKVNVTSKTVNVPFDYHGTIVANVTDGTNQTSSSYNVRIILRAVDLSYDNKKTGLNCEDAQCALDELKKMLKD